MQKIKLEELAVWTRSRILSGDPCSFVQSFSTDTRTLSEGDFFIPVKGENFDGHDYVGEAVKKGASGFVYSNPTTAIERIRKEGKNMQVLSCGDSLDFLKDAAKNYAKSFSCIKIGITGSVGKTTTKNFLVSILKIKNPVAFTPKNYNNEFGVPLSIFQIGQDTRYFIAELGMRAKGQIEELSRICGLDYGLITAVGKSHIEYFESEEDIARAKAEISASLGENKGILFLHDDDKYAAMISKMVPCDSVMCGTAKDLPYHYALKGSDGLDRFRFDMYEGKERKTTVSLQIPGRHTVTDAFLAASVALYLKEPIENIKKGLEETSSESNRMEIVQTGSKIIINDSYNANPMSMREAVDTLQRVAEKKGLRSVAVLADMLELGKDSAECHAEIGRYLKAKGVDVLIAYGPDSKKTCESFQNQDKNCYHFEDKKKLEEKVKQVIKDHDAILIKGSRANRMEDIYQLIAEKG